MTTFQVTPAGTILGSDGIEFPQVYGNRYYDAFVESGATASPAAAITLDDRKDAGKVVAAQRAAAAVHALTEASGRDQVYNALLFQEAQRYADMVLLGETPVPQEYKLMAAEVDANLYGDIAEASESLLNVLDALKVDIATIRGKHILLIADIDAATNQAGIDAALEGADLAP